MLIIKGMVRLNKTSAFIILGVVVLAVAASFLFLRKSSTNPTSDTVNTYDECVEKGYQVSTDGRCLASNGDVFGKNGDLNRIDFKTSGVYTCSKGDTMALESDNDEFVKVILNDGSSYLVSNKERNGDSIEYTNKDKTTRLIIPESGSNLRLVQYERVIVEKCTK